jgi:hydroxymethylpyrimidine pyrophosphatase-like HAD family hydrolase
LTPHVEPPFTCGETVRDMVIVHVGWPDCAIRAGRRSPPAHGTGRACDRCVKLCVLALDYDGTSASDDVMDPGVRSAIADARARRIVVVLVTGRRLTDLRRVAGDLHFLDAVVAENGAVLHLPESGYSAVLAPPPAVALLQELTMRGIVHAPGECLVEASAADAQGILDAIRSRELPLSIHFNRGRLMVLPQAISKATGLREALTILRLSERNTMGFGDAENDHELLRACEIGAAAGWGSESVRAIADLVVEGKSPADLGPYLQRLIACGQLPAAKTARRSLLLGHTDQGESFELAVRGRNVLVAGDARSGKSWVAGLLAEQLILHGYSVCVIDPEGDYRALDALPGVVALGGANPLPRPHELLHVLRHPHTSVVIDLSHVHHRDKVEYARALLPALAMLRRRTALPHRIFVDEAHYFLDGSSPDDLLDLRGDGYTLVTYRASHLPNAVLDASEVVLVTCESDPTEVKALHALCHSDEPIDRWSELLGGLGIGEAAALPITDEAGASLRRFHLGRRITHHVRHREKYVDVPIPDARAFVFTQRDQPEGTRATTLKAFVHALDVMPSEVLEGHARREDFSRWLAEVFGDYPLALSVRALEDRSRQEHDSAAVPAIASTIRGRYDLAHDEAGSCQ